ncbi:PREDICTED: uncharacterized protein LOC109340973 [Lupinus angustifolius]|uniref:uncharacterized protein LOC109340973 n=1 Tax=Lupinus angustifolius TaxID=3871 RepID=UPI00092EE4A0|nr:PREDICTED: uncharacterized protein LOC109340973 [Lupinus angustifolius]
MADSSNIEKPKETQLTPNSNDIHNPYYLHPGESLGAVLVTPPLDGTNYGTWSISMRRALKSKNKYKFVDGTIITPNATDPEFDISECCNTMIVSWITRSLSPQISQSIVYIESAQEFWRDLRERFTNGDYFRLSDILQDLHSMKQGDRSLSSFFTELKTQWEELESLRPIPSCMCNNKCTCGILDTIKAYRDNEYVICFLKGLSESFNNTKTQILLMEPLPSINKAFSLLQQQESQFAPETSNSKVLFNTNNPKQQSRFSDQGQTWRTKGNSRRSNYTQGRGRSPNKFYGNRGNGTKICTFCGREGHTVETCYFKHGFPPNSQQERSKQHTTMINNTTSNESKTQNESTTPKQEAPRTFNFGAAEYTELTSLLHNLGAAKPGHNINQLNITAPNTNNSPTNRQEITGNTSTWVLDTRATNHVSPDLKHFTAFHSIRPITINLPNGTTTLARYSGTVVFSNLLVLHNVLYIPDFKFNLISVFKLTKSLHCKLIFDDSK